MSSIQINDIFEELFEENRRLLNELKFADKCLNVFVKFKTFVDFISVELKTNLESNVSQKLEQLNKEVEEVLRHKEKNLKDSIETRTIVSEHNSELIKTKIISSKVVNNGFPNSEILADQLFRHHEISSVANEQQFEIKSIQRIYNSNEEMVPKTGSVLKDLLKCDNNVRNKESVNKQNMAVNNIREDQPIDRNHEINESKESPDLTNRVFCEFVGCGRHYSSRDHMKSHYKSHFLERSFTCDVKGCDYRTWRLRDLKAHINGHKGLRPYVCSTCGKGFTCPKLLSCHVTRVHTLSGQSFVCNIDNCNKSFKGEHVLRAHQKFVHILEKKFVCDETNCDFRTVDECRLKNHKNTKHSNKRPFVCTHEGCSKTYKRMTDLNHHMALHKQSARHRCDFEGCNKAFKRNYDLKKHQAIHSDIKYDCDWPGCDFQTNTQQKLKSHKLVHSSERNHICDWPQCTKAFKRKRDLIIHLRVHRGDKRHACVWPGCQYRCVDCTNMAKHMRVHRK